MDNIQEQREAGADIEDCMMAELSKNCRYRQSFQS